MLSSILQRRVKTDGAYEDEVTLKDAVTTTYLGMHRHDFPSIF
jgi:hypothetical protein